MRNLYTIELDFCISSKGTTYSAPDLRRFDIRKFGDMNLATVTHTQRKEKKIE